MFNLLAVLFINTKLPWTYQYTQLRTKRRERRTKDNESYLNLQGFLRYVITFYSPFAYKPICCCFLIVALNHSQIHKIHKIPGTEINNKIIKI